MDLFGFQGRGTQLKDIPNGKFDCHGHHHFLLLRYNLLSFFFLVGGGGVGGAEGGTLNPSFC